MSEREDEEQKGLVVRLVRWFDSRLGLSYPMLRPAPQYSINPFYWLGALTVVAFVIQGVTGVIMMLYYIPSPSQAYTSTSYVFDNVYYGRFLETVHLYTAYAMIMLAFMHMMRGYFVSVHKKPREMMWIVGMLMGFVTLGFGFTGYLLPWTVVSKSATDVGIGMIDALPPQIASFLSFLIIGAGSDATELLRFYDLHVVMLPAVLLVLLAVKMYMLESHGISEPATGIPASEAKKKLIPIFPDVSLYLLELAAMFGAGMLLISVVFPLQLPPEYSPALASQYTPQPDWYFLWIYQILKIDVFEGPTGLAIALSVVTLIFIALFLLPFLDRGETRSISKRPKFISLGAIFITEIVTMAYWGLVTPGRIIPAEQAVLILGGIALLVSLVSFSIYRLIYSKARTRLPTVKAQPPKAQAMKIAFSFIFLLAAGSLAIGSMMDSVVQTILIRADALILSRLILSLGLFSIVGIATMYFLYRLDLSTNSIRRKVRLFEMGWRNGE